MEAALLEQLQAIWPDADDITVAGLAPLSGGYSRETFAFEAHVRRGGEVECVALLLRRDPEHGAILDTDRVLEHGLLGELRRCTALPVPRSFFAVRDPQPFGQPAMVIERMAGNAHVLDLFHGGPDALQAEDVCTHFCELLAELHTLAPGALDVAPGLADPRHVGIDVSSWDRYMDTTFAYILDGYGRGDYSPIPVIVDAALTLRRNRPKPLPLAVVHGDCQPSNLLYAGGRVSALFDWENAHIGDPREDLGYLLHVGEMMGMDVFGAVKKDGGFLGHYNRLTGYVVTPEEVDYFRLFSILHIMTPVMASVKQRMVGAHHGLMPVYITQLNAVNHLLFARILGYPLTKEAAAC